MSRKKSTLPAYSERKGALEWSRPEGDIRHTLAHEDGSTPAIIVEAYGEFTLYLYDNPAIPCRSIDAAKTRAERFALEKWPAIQAAA